MTSQTRIPVFLALLIAAIAIVNALAHAYYLYWRLPWFDVPMHFFGGVWVAGMAVWAYELKRPLSLSEIVWVPLAATLIVSAGWELYEFAADVFADRGRVNTIADTIADTVFASMGSLSVSCYYMYIRWRERRISHL